MLPTAALKRGARLLFISVSGLADWDTVPLKANLQLFSSSAVTTERHTNVNTYLLLFQLHVKGCSQLLQYTVNISVAGA